MCRMTQPDAVSVGHRGEDEIRERLLNQLGIFLHDAEPQTRHHPLNRGKLEEEYVPTPPPTSSRKSFAAKTTQAPHHPFKQFPELLDYSTQYEEPLYLHPELLFQPEKEIQFCPEVTVVNIPSYEDYSKSTHERLWSSVREIQTNGERNVMEFVADNSEWRKVKEEGSFIAVHGELHHPATYRQLKANQKLNKDKKPTKGHPPNKRVKRKSTKTGLKSKRKGRVFVSRSTPSLTRFADT